VGARGLSCRPHVRRAGDQATGACGNAELRHSTLTGDAPIVVPSDAQSPLPYRTAACLPEGAGLTVAAQGSIERMAAIAVGRKLRKMLYVAGR
jgi:hypothetical protein